MSREPRLPDEPTKVAGDVGGQPSDRLDDGLGAVAEENCSVHDLQVDLGTLEDEIDRGLRAVELRTKLLMADFDAERTSLNEQLSEERRRVSEQEHQLKACRKEAERARGQLADANAKLVAQEQEVEALEDEIDLMIGKVEDIINGRLSKAEARVSQVAALAEAKGQETAALRADVQSLRVKLDELAATIPAAPAEAPVPSSDERSD